MDSPGVWVRDVLIGERREIKKDLVNVDVKHSEESIRVAFFAISRLRAIKSTSGFGARNSKSTCMWPY